MASKNIVLKGATWNGVESVDFPVSGGGTALYVETSDADATAADIANGKKAYVNGSLIIGSATAPVLTTKSITQNGTYNASSDSADGYSSVTVNVSGGGGDSWSWMGKNPTKVHTFTPEHVLFKDNGIASWTYSTSSTTIEAVSDYSTTVQCDLVNYDYVQVVKYRVHFDYGESTPNAAVQDYASTITSYVYGYCSNYNAISTEVPNYPTSNTGPSDNYIYYINSSGVIAGAHGSNYGLYMSTGTAATLSPTTSATPAATFKRPALSARGSSTYFSQAAFNALDMNNSYFDVICEIWRVDRGTSDRGFATIQALDTLNNGI